jgi:hypothetical protein
VPRLLAKLFQHLRFLLLDQLLQVMVVSLKLDLKTPQLQVCLDARLDFLELEGLGHIVRRPE